MTDARRRGLACAALAAAMLAAAPASADTPPGRLPFVTCSEAEGFGSWLVLDIAQDTSGFLWIATDGSLHRHDGLHVTSVPLPDSLIGQELSLAPGRDGAILCWSRTTAARFRGGRWTMLGEQQGLVGHVRGVAQAPGGSTWVSTTQGLFREGTDGRFEAMPGWPRAPYSGMWFDADGAWIGGVGTLHHLRPDGALRTLRVGPPFDTEIASVVRDARGRVWLHDTYRLWSMAPENGDLRELSGAGPHIADMAVDRHGDVWIAARHGLLRTDSDAVRFERGLPMELARSVLVDREGSLWVGGMGLHRLAGRGLWRRHGVEEGLPHNEVWSVRRDRHGSLWAATSGGVARARGERWEAHSLVPADAYPAMTVAPDGSLWFGSTAAAAYRYEPAERRVTAHRLDGAFLQDRVYTILFDAEGSLWAASSRGLFFARDPANAEVLEAVPLLPSESRVVVPDLLVDRAGRRWLSGFLGLLVLSGDDLFAFREADGLLGDHPSFFAELPDDEICFAYHDAAGITCARFDPEMRGSVRHILPRDGLAPATIYQLGADRFGRLWSGHGRGVDVIDGGRVVASYDVADGLPGNDTSGWGFFADDNGDVWISTSTGLGQFLGSRQGAPLTPPGAVITSARAGERELPLDAIETLPHDHGMLDIVFAVPSFVHPAQLEIESRLAGLDESFEPNPERHARYRGLLAGEYVFEARARRRHGEWGPVARFAFVVTPPFWQSWWFRSLVAVGALGGVAGMLAAQRALFRRRRRHLENLVDERTRELRAAQARAVALEKSTTERQMAGGFAHEMRNALAGARMLVWSVRRDETDSLCVKNSEHLKELFLRLRGGLSADDRAAFAAALWEINRNEEQIDAVLADVDVAHTRALAIVAGILEYARLGHDIPGTAAVSLATVVEAVVAESARGMQEHGIAVVTEIAPDAVVIGTASHVHSIVTNLLLNARDALTGPGGPPPGERRIRLAAGVENESVVLRVQDSGPGVAPENRHRIFDAFFSTKPSTGTGLGLSVVRKTVQLYGGDVELESEAGGGAVFAVRWPKVRER